MPDGRGHRRDIHLHKYVMLLIRKAAKKKKQQRKPEPTTQVSLCCSERLKHTQHLKQRMIKSNPAELLSGRSSRWRGDGINKEHN